jgi:hypothetical protein
MTKPKTNPIKQYDGTKEILDEYRVVNQPERELLASIILQAISNVHFQAPKWQEDLEFISGEGNWNWICSHLGMNPKQISRLALKAACGNMKVIHKH